MIALGSYAYDWPKGQPARVLSVGQALQLAHDNGTVVSRAAPQRNPVFTYTGSDGVPHVVWMLDSETFTRQRAAAMRYRVKGIALWRLGLEDAAVWNGAAPAQANGVTGPVPAPVCSLLPGK